jgi:hypothetical protein
MKKIFKFGIEFLVLMSVITLALSANVAATSLLPIDATTNTEISAGIPAPPDDQSGQEILKTVVIDRGLAYVKAIILSVGILYIMIIGYQLLTKGDQEEEITTQKRAVIYALIAFMMISMGEEFAQIFNMEKGKGTLLENPQEIQGRINIFDKQVEIAITFIKYVIGSFATLMVVRSGIKLVTAGGDEEQRGKHKKSILYSGGGLILIFIGQIFIDKVFYKIDKPYTGIDSGVQPTIDAQAGVEQIVGITNFIVSLVGPVAVLMLVVAAVLYATANGDEEKMEKAKRILVSSVVAIFIIFGAFALVSTVISGKLSAIGAITE